MSAERRADSLGLLNREMPDGACLQGGIGDPVRELPGVIERGGEVEGAADDESGSGDAGQIGSQVVGGECVAAGRVGAGIYGAGAPARFGGDALPPASSTCAAGGPIARDGGHMTGEWPSKAGTQRMPRIRYPPTSAAMLRAATASR